MAEQELKDARIRQIYVRERLRELAKELKALKEEATKLRAAKPAAAKK